MSSAPPPARRYAAWIDRNRWVILAIAAGVTALSTARAVTLPLRTDMARLLPPSERSVRDLRNLEHRTRAIGTVIAAVISSDAKRREAATHALAARIRKLGPKLVGTVTVDDGAARRFAWKHRFLFAPLTDLVAARDGLAKQIKQAKLEANPLYVSLDDDSGGNSGKSSKANADIKRLRKRLHDAEAKVHHPDELVSKNGRMQLVIIHAPFPSSNIAMSKRLVKALHGVANATMRAYGPGVRIGLADEIVTGVAEQRAILHGMVIAAVVTVIIVGLSLWLFFRSMAAVWALMGALAAGSLATFGFTRLTIGYLNSATAFLSAIVVGNGINFGIIVLSRHLEERRRGREGTEALAVALGGSFTGTLTAALAAGVAYASLIVTDFRGFRDFGIIGGVGMVLCWLSAYTVLPAAIAALEHARRLVPGRAPALGPLLARLLPRNLSRVAVVSAGLFVVCGVATWHYLASDPYEYNWEHLRADSAEAMTGRWWMHHIDLAFGHGLASGFAIGVDSRKDADKVAAILRSHAQDNKKRPPGNAALFRRVSTIEDALPRHQAAKLKVLRRLHDMLDKRTLALLPKKERAEAKRLRPPANLRALAIPDIPAQLIPQFVEKDGARGKLLYADQASRFNGWHGRDMLAFSAAVRKLNFPPHTHLGGSAFVFADILRAVGRDGPRATLAALAGVVVFVLLLVGATRYALATLAAAITGTLAMLACAWLLGLKVNFLDFVALPITIGISVDYAVNVVGRERSEASGVRRAIATTGGAVVLCSWTTIVGYGSLLLSANAGIRSFGLAAILGETTCLLAAITLAPALLHVLSTRRRRAGRLGAES